jgi:tetratricopeptide (TPR) repeat protein
MRIAALAVCWLCLMPRIAGADAAPDVRAQAKQHYEAGERAFRLGDFDRAIKEWRDSYELAAIPLLLYNLGQAYRQKGDNKQALFFYQQFVATGPTGESRQIAEKRIEELKQAAAVQQKAQTAPPQGPEPPIRSAPLPPPRDTVDHRSRLKIVGWSLTAGGLAVTAVGMGLGIQGVRDYDDAQHASTLPRQQELQQESDTFQPVGWAMVGVGGAALVSGVVILAVRR